MSVCFTSVFSLVGVCVCVCLGAGGYVCTSVNVRDDCWHICAWRQINEGTGGTLIRWQTNWNMMRSHSLKILSKFNFNLQQLVDSFLEILNYINEIILFYSVLKSKVFWQVYFKLIDLSWQCFNQVHTFIFKSRQFVCFKLGSVAQPFHLHQFSNRHHL